MRRGFVHLILCLVIILTIVLGAAIYLNRKSSNQEPIKPSSETGAALNYTSETTSWKTFATDDYSFKFPSILQGTNELFYVSDIKRDPGHLYTSPLFSVNSLTEKDLATNPPGTNINDLWPLYLGEGKDYLIRLQDKFIDGNIARFYTNNKNQQELIIKKDNKYYSIFINLEITYPTQQQQELVDKILSSFRFTGQNQESVSEIPPLYTGVLWDPVQNYPLKVSEVMYDAPLKHITQDGYLIESTIMPKSISSWSQLLKYYEKELTSRGWQIDSSAVGSIINYRKNGKYFLIGETPKFDKQNNLEEEKFFLQYSK